MSQLVLTIGDKTTSSWSLRPWLLLKMHDIAFEERAPDGFDPESIKRMMQQSPSGKLPLLQHNSLMVWDSLAIMEYLNEVFPSIQGWPEDRHKRAHARSIASEMHAEFLMVRTTLPFNCRLNMADYPASPKLESEMNRLQTLLHDCLSRYQGPFLFGEFAIADAMFAPVVLRFKTYDIEPKTPELHQYCQRVQSLPPVRQWVSEAKAEAERK